MLIHSKLTLLRRISIAVLNKNPSNSFLSVRRNSYTNLFVNTIPVDFSGRLLDRTSRLISGMTFVLSAANGFGRLTAGVCG